MEIVAGREGYTVNLAGKTSLGELAAVISMSSLHMGVDSAAPHIAAALGTPTVTIHGPTDWRAWRIVNEQQRVVSPAMNCLPCNMTGCEGGGKSRCLEELGEEPVISAVLEQLERIHKSVHL
jgi:heptosyltransferase-3